MIKTFRKSFNILVIISLILLLTSCKRTKTSFWEDGEKKEDEYYEVGDEDIEEYKERVIYKLKP